MVLLLTVPAPTDKGALADYFSRNNKEVHREM